MSNKLSYTIGVDSVIISLIDSESDKIRETREFSVDALPESFDNNGEPKSLAAYGLAKIMQDRNSAPRPVDEKFTDMAATYDDVLSQGLWKAPIIPGSRKAQIDPIFAQAVADLKGWSIQHASKILGDVEPTMRKKLATSEAVAARMAELRSTTEAVSQEDVDDVMGLMSSSEEVA